MGHPFMGSLAGVVGGVAGRLVRVLPCWSGLQSLAETYVDRCRGDSDGNPATNGEHRLLRKVLPGCRVVFDIGANVGDWTAAALRLAPHLAVHCFEPSPTTFARIAGRQFPPQVRLNNLGLASTPGEAQLQVYAPGAGTNSLHRRDVLGAAETVERVEITTFDRYCQVAGIAEVDFVKIDVEGHELEVFRGMSEALSRKAVRLIQFEYGGTYLDARIQLRDVFELVSAFGYAVYKVMPRRLQPVPSYSARLDNFKYSNWVATRDPVG